MKAVSQSSLPVPAFVPALLSKTEMAVARGEYKVGRSSQFSAVQLRCSANATLGNPCHSATTYDNLAT